MNNSYLFTLLLALSLHLFSFNNLLAIDVTWTGATSSNWTTASNWDTNSIPTAEDDVIINSSTNQPRIEAEGEVSIKSLEISSGARLFISSKATLNIDGSEREAIENRGSLSNAGILKIGQNTDIGREGLSNRGSFTNGGEVYIDNTGDDAIECFSASITNFGGIIKIGQNGAIEGNGISLIRSSARLWNSEGGEIHIDQTYDTALYSWEATINNYGVIKIGQKKFIEGDGISNRTATFNNHNTGEIYIDQFEDNGINNRGGSLSIGSFNRYDPSFFNNWGTIKIAQNFPLYRGEYYWQEAQGILNRIDDGIFTNKACGSMYVNGEIGNIQDASLYNEGLFFTNYGDSHVSQNIFQNTGVIIDTYGAFKNTSIDNKSLIMQFSTCGSNVFEDVTREGDSNNYSFTDFYTDQALTTIAGDYDTDEDTFTSNIEAEKYPLYLEVTDNENDCTKLIELPIDTSIPEAIIEVSDLCLDTDVTLQELGTDAINWIWTGPDYFYSSQQNAVIEAATVENNGEYTVKVTGLNGCTSEETVELTMPEPIEFDLNNPTQSQTTTGTNVYSVEVCGGTIPYSIDLESEGGFASSDLLPSSNVGCQMLQITYGTGVTWTAEITDTNDCNSEASTISSDDLGGTPLLMIDGFNVVQETGVGKLDGELTVNVSGGDDSCDDYTYDWSGPNTNVSNTDGATGNTITGLGAGTYSVVINDCVGNSATASITLSRTNGRGGRGRKTSLEVSTITSLQLYPNPAKDLVTIDLQVEEATSDMLIQIHDLTGRTLWAQNVTETSSLNVSLADFDSGFYLVTISQSNHTIAKEKLLVVK